MARPPKDINWETVRKKMEAGCTAKEIFSSHDTRMSPDTFYSRFKEEFGCSFSDYSDESNERGIGDLKLMAHAKAMQGNITTLIFLLKCRAGMREPELVHNIAANQTQIDQSHLIMELQHKIAELEAANADKS